MIRRLLLPALFVFALSTYAQTDSTSQGLDGGRLVDQFDYVISKSNRYQDYKVIKRTWMDNLKANVADSLKARKADIDALKTTEKGLRSEKADIANELAATQEQLAAVTAEKDTMVVLGISTAKGSYSAIMWSTVVILLIITVFLAAKFKQSNIGTVKAKGELAELQGEFDDYRKKSREKEQKLKRELQDEINKRVG